MPVDHTPSEAELLAKHGLHPEPGFFESVKKLMHDAIQLFDHANPLFSSIANKFWKQKDKVVDAACSTFAGTELYILTTQAIAGVKSPEKVKQAYLVGMLTWLLLQNSKAVQDSFVDHSTVFAAIVGKLVSTKLGPEFQLAFAEMINRSQKHYDDIRNAPATTSSPSPAA